MAFTAFKLERHLCEIVALDGTEIHCECTNLTYGIHLLEYVCEKVGIKESCYFGLKYRHHKDGKYSWLQTDKFIGQQVHTKIYVLELHIKYWPSTPFIVEQDITRYQMVLATRAKILNGELTSTLPIQALLASYLLQAELGNHKDIAANGGYHTFISNETLQFFPNQPDDFLDKVKEFHEKHHDVNPSAAELLYLENARKILLYGMELHEVLDADGIRVMLGVGHDGVHIIQNGVILNNMYWANVLNLKPRKSRRIVYLKLKGTKKDDFETMKLGFISPTVTDWKRLYRLCRDQMGFFNALKSDDKVDCKEKKGKKSDPSIRYSHCIGEHYRIPASFVRINSVKFVEKKKQHKEEQKRPDKNQVKRSQVSIDNGLVEKLEKGNSKCVEEQPSHTDECDAVGNEKNNMNLSTKEAPCHTEKTSTKHEILFPVTPQVISMTTEGDITQYSRQRMVSNDQSFVSECGSVIESPIILNDEVLIIDSVDLGCSKIKIQVSSVEDEVGNAVEVITSDDKEPNVSWTVVEEARDQQCEVTASTEVNSDDTSNTEDADSKPIIKHQSEIPDSTSC